MCGASPVTAQGPTGARAAAGLHEALTSVRWRDGSQSVTPTQMRTVEATSGLALGVKRPMAGTLQLIRRDRRQGRLARNGGEAAAPGPAHRRCGCPTAGCACTTTIPNDPEFAGSPDLHGPAEPGGGRRQPHARVGPLARQQPASWWPWSTPATCPTPTWSTGSCRATTSSAPPTVSQDNVDGRDSDPTDPGDFVPAGQTCQDGSEPGQQHVARHARGQRAGRADQQRRGHRRRGPGRADPAGARLGPLRRAVIRYGRWHALGRRARRARRAGQCDAAKVVNVSLGGGSCSSIEQQAVNDHERRRRGGRWPQPAIRPVPWKPPPTAPASSPSPPTPTMARTPASPTSARRSP